ncbi:MAG: hypothetical protein EOP37_24015 [Rubrivivax sp.]|nr:MAG: hypothetical protein EOP37_24015 [Rubrivivax sp.]
MSSSMTVDFRHIRQRDGRAIKVCADVIARGNFLTWTATVHMFPAFFEMTGSVRKANDESDRHAVIGSIGQALAVGRLD